MNDRTFKLSPVAKGIAMALGATTLTPAAAQEMPEAIEEITVTGVRRSLTAAADVKRQSDGVVDAIVAEDIGKFPDTNLAESLQRITGVSIDRTSGLGAEGEGQRITVRGIGPEFNLVLLNGRQMPTSTLEPTSTSTSRAFDFSNLASESVSAVEVYKTSIATIPTGGIGATVNIRTARPLEIGQQTGTLGVKAVGDSSDPDDSWSPELSGIYTNVFADDTFGISVSGAYQERKFGYNQAGTNSGWIPENRVADWAALPPPGDPVLESNFVNPPAESDLYSLPQNLIYSFNDLERERLNGQLVLQWAATDALTATLDYTYSELAIEQRRHELSTWFIHVAGSGTTFGEFTDGPIVTPLEWSEDWTGRDVGHFGGISAWKTELDSLGFNLDWVVGDTLGFALDFHTSSSESGRDGPYGSSAGISGVSFPGGRATVDFRRDFPVLSLDLPAGGLDPSLAFTSGAFFRNSFAKQDIDQIDLSGSWDINGEMSLDFGITRTEVENRTAFSNVQYNDWGGIGSPDDFADDIWQIRDVRSLFDSLSGSGNPALFNQMYTWDFNTVAGIRETTTGQTMAATDAFTNDLRTTEESTSAYVQFNASFDVGDMNANVRAGLRYEDTDVDSSALVPIPLFITWDAANEYGITFGDPDFTALSGSYDYVLPSIDLSLDVTDELIVRASASKTIGRPDWQSIQGGQTLDPLVRRQFGNAQAGDPGLKPNESKNGDLSVEWYYSEGSYASVAYFYKDVANYVGISTVEGTPFNLPHPGNGQWYDEANMATGGLDDQSAIRQYIFETYGDTEFVNITGTDAGGNFTGTIQGVPGQDPAARFLIAVPTNQSEVIVDGFELAVQHLFGETGFGVQANYTKVDSDIGYNNAATNDQFAILGLSDSANLVAFYDREGWIARLAYNWRDEFLSGTADGNGIANPVYTEEYAQLDAIVSYTFEEQGITVFAEGFNLTDENLRLRSRRAEQVEFITQQGPRFGIGARWVF